MLIEFLSTRGGAARWLVWAVFALSACSQGPFLDETACPFSIHPSQEEGKTVRCGVLNTFAEHGGKSNQMIQVPYLVFHTQAFQTSEQKGIATIHLAGGPGQSWKDLGLETIKNTSSANFIRDNIFFEQRGTGVSTPKLTCPTQKNNENDADFIDRCASALRKKDIKPENYNTPELAKDVEDLRKLLGYKKLVLNGVSYGTAWGLEILRQNSKNIAAAVLDSVVTPTIAPLSESASIDDRALTQLFAECATNGPCSAAYGDVEATMKEVLSSLQQTPAAITGSTSTLSAQDFYDLVLNQLEIDPMAAPLLIQTVHEAVTNNTAVPLQEQSNPFEGGLSGLALGQYLSVACSDSQSVTQAVIDADLAKVRPEFRPYASDVSDLVRLCALWPFKHRPASEFSAVQSEVPTLVLAGNVDIRTPPAWAQAAASTLPRSIYVEVPGVGHDVAAWGVPCVGTVLSAFMHTLGPVDTSCVAQIAVEFVLPDQVTRAPRTWVRPRRDLIGRLPRWSRTAPRLWR